MVLGGLLKGVTQLFDDDGFAATSASSNFVESSVVTGDLDAGYIAGIIDSDLTSYLGYQLALVGTKTITFDLLTRRQNLIFTGYFIVNNTGGNNTGTLTVDYSDNNISWTNVETYTMGASPWSAGGNLSVNFSARYIRFKMDVTICAGGSFFKLYYLKLTKAMS